MLKTEAYSNSVLFLSLSKKNGWKAGKLYALKPLGTFFGWTRGDVADRIDQSGVTESMAINVPRVDYETGCPMLMVQDGGTWQDVGYNDTIDYTGDEGTIFVEAKIVFSEDIQGIITLSDAGIFDDYLAVYNVGAGGTKKIVLTTYTNPDQNDVEITVADDGIFNIAFAYKLSTMEYSFAINGVIESSGTFANNVPSGAVLDRLYLGKIGSSYMENSRIIGVQFFDSKLDDTSLVNITT